MPSSIFSCQQGNAPINKISSICACVYLYTVYKLLIFKSVPLWVNKRTFTNPCPQSEHYNKLCYGSYVWPVHIKVTAPTSEHANNKLAAKNPKTKPKNKTQRNAVYSAVWRKHEKTSVHICVCATSTCPVRKLECVTVRTRLCVCVCVCTCAHVCVWEWKRVSEREWGRVVCFYSDQQDLQLWRTLSSAAGRKTSPKTNGVWLISSCYLINVFNKEKNNNKKPQKTVQCPNHGHIAHVLLSLALHLDSLSPFPLFISPCFFLGSSDSFPFKETCPANTIWTSKKERKKEKTLLFLNCCCNSIIAPLWQE